MANEWYTDTLQLRDFAKALDDAGYVESRDEVYEKPYKFTDEFQLWQEYGFPDQTDSSWDDFVNAISVEEDGDGS